MFNIRKITDEDRERYQSELEKAKSEVIGGGQFYVFECENEERLLYKLSRGPKHVFYEIRNESGNIVITNFSYNENELELTIRFNDYLLSYDCLNNIVVASKNGVRSFVELEHSGYSYGGTCYYHQYNPKQDKGVTINYTHPVVPGLDKQKFYDSRLKKPYLVSFRKKASKKEKLPFNGLLDENYICIDYLDNIDNWNENVSDTLFYRIMFLGKLELFPFYDRRPYPYDEIESMLLENGFEPMVPEELIMANNRQGINFDYLTQLVDETLTLEESLVLERTKKDNKKEN